MGFVLIDRLLDLEPGRRARARAVFPADLELFADHFPGQPIVPGVLLTETMCQTAGWLIAATREFVGWPLLARIDRATFRRLVTAGEELVVEATMRGSREETYEVVAQVQAAGETVADARLLFRVFRFELTGNAAEGLDTWTRATFERLNGPAAMRIVKSE
jgi:3-hydroxyacyl-[acyl-carrier-protein] dehydratase